MAVVLEGYYIERTSIVGNHYFNRELGKFSRSLSNATIYPNEDMASEDLRTLSKMPGTVLTLRPLYKEVDLDDKKMNLNESSKSNKDCDHCPFKEEYLKLQYNSRLNY